MTRERPLRTRGLRGRWSSSVLALALVASCLAACSPTTPSGSASDHPATSTPAPPTTPSSPAAAPGTTAARRPVVVGLGDSVMSGAACGCRPFLDLYAAGLGQRADTTAQVRNLGKSGLTTSGLTAQVASTATAQTLATATVVVVTIGANDLVPLVDRWRRGACDGSCVSDSAAALSGPLDRVLGQIHMAAPGAALLVTDYWNAFEDGDVADGDYGQGFARWSDTVTAAANARICAAARTVDATCVDLYRPFNGTGHKDPTPLLADDGDHPNAAGHELIARALLEATPSNVP